MMSELDFLSGIGGTGGIILGLFFILWKMGIIQFRKNGNGTTEHRIKDLESHAEIANREMGEIKKDISDIKADVAWVRGKLDGKI
mgnify:CR=1 FL=1